MRVLVLLSLAACAPEAEDPEPQEMGCYGSGELRTESDGPAVEWYTTETNGDLDTVVTRTWADAARTVLVSAERQTWSDGLRVSRTVDIDGDGRDDSLEFSDYDDHGREVWSVVKLLQPGANTYTTEWIGTRSYDDAGQLIEEVDDAGADGVIDQVDRYTWSDGRQIAAETYDGEGVVLDRGWRTYAGSAPDPDHLEEIDFGDDGEVDRAVVRAYDGDGNLVVESGEEDGVPWTRTLTWEDGRSVREESAVGGVVHLAFWRVHDDLGLVLESGVEQDPDLDGTIDQASWTRWEWVCP